MSKECSLVVGAAEVPLIGIVVSSLRAGELAAFPWVHTALPRSSGAAATAAANSDVRQDLMTPRIRSSHALVFLPGGRSHRQTPSYPMSHRPFLALLPTA